MPRTPILIVLLLFLGACDRSAAPEQELPPELKDGDFDYVNETDPRSPEEERDAFHLPPGFEAQIFAAEPDIGKPINMAFDAKGRLWVTQSREYPFPASEGAGHDRLTILEDTNGDGRADSFTDFADDLNIPIGVMPVADGAIVFSIPNLYRLIDEDGDDRADSREVLVGPFGYIDTHGMVNNLLRGLDGWIHAGHGYRNTSTPSGTDGATITMVSGNTFRFRLDGTGLQTTTTGRVNPFGFAYDELGYLYGVDCHSTPIYQLIRGGDYPHFGKTPTGIGFPPVMMLHTHGPTAIAGFAFYTSDQFPPDFQENFFSGNPVSGRVNRDKIVYHGSTPEGVQQPDFLVSDDPWFRPVDIKLGPDGALYVADFYNRIIGHYEVPLDHPGRDRERGRIWRIVYTGADYRNEPADATTDWSSVDLDELLAGLDHRDLRVRMTVADQLVDRFGGDASAPVKSLLTDESSSPYQQAHGLWILHRLDALDDALLDEKLSGGSQLVSLHALRILLERSSVTPGQRALAISFLDSSDPHLQRAAAEVLARFPEASTVEPLLALQSAVPDSDTHLAYTVRQSLRDHLRDDEVLQHVLAESWNESDSRALAGAMIGVDAPGAAIFLLNYIRMYEDTRGTLANYVGHIARHLPAGEGDAMIEFAQTSSDVDVQLDLFRAIRGGLMQRGSDLSPGVRAWGIELVAQFLGATPAEYASPENTPEDAARLRFAAELAGEFEMVELVPSLEAIVSSSEIDAEARAAAGGSLFKLDPEVALPALAGRLQDGGEATPFRSRLAALLGGASRADAQQIAIDALKDAPYQVQVAAAQALAGSEAGSVRLVEAASEGIVPASLLLDPRVETQLLAGLPASARPEYDRVTADLEPVDLVRQRQIEARVAGFRSESASSEHGAEVFGTYCMTCHQAKGSGGLVGPQLDGIGRRGALALTEKVLAPNRNVTSGFQNYTLKMKDGSVKSGLLRREEGEALVFANALGEEFVVARQDIAEQTPAPYSLMPGNFYETIDEADYQDLLAFLLTLR